MSRLLHSHTESDSLNSDDDWIDLSLPIRTRPAPKPAKPPITTTPADDPPTIQDIITHLTEDEKELLLFFSITTSPDRLVALRKFYLDALADLTRLPFSQTYTQSEKVDYLCLKNYLSRNLRRLDLQEQRQSSPEVYTLLPFAVHITRLCEARQRVNMGLLKPGGDWRAVAGDLGDAAEQARSTKEWIEKGELSSGPVAARRAVKAARELVGQVKEFFNFFDRFDPEFGWWVGEPYKDFVGAVEGLVKTIETRLLGRSGKEDADDGEIVGDPVGREGLLLELEGEMIPYTPEELIGFANEQWAWCESEMAKAATELGFGGDWAAALDHVKDKYEPPGGQVAMVKGLVDESAAYVKSHDLVTVPPVAEQTWRMFMLSPEEQKTTPFFLGGEEIFVAYPTGNMSHAAKMMSLRGNNRHMARGAAFHEMFPGHRLQLYMSARYKPYRRLFRTSFYNEGWAMYWELLLWERGDFFKSAEDRIGTLFWRKHRCARIIFSLKFHLGEMSAQECVDFLVDKVGHERATAEGEIRRSLDGDWGKEVLEKKGWSEKEFHDRVLKASEMPIEMLRALLLGETEVDLARDLKSDWKFYDELDRNRE
ncbi:hypothetical protein B0T17DRAFT_589137 [Bombardia bombarda]|uniref:X-Pro dipeptidyl-peptidase n=1 Tax=Bombardia bombarda TaxID=252184 RepID=A0AA39X8J1_9PEZI|nr:hypothetical protein B0T17DRAFT_589137 [Bombardia bombarda]